MEKNCFGFEDEKDFILIIVIAMICFTLVEEIIIISDLSMLESGASVYYEFWLSNDFKFQNNPIDSCTSTIF